METWLLKERGQTGKQYNVTFYEGGFALLRDGTGYMRWLTEDYLKTWGINLDNKVGIK